MFLPDLGELAEILVLGDVSVQTMPLHYGWGWGCSTFQTAHIHVIHISSYRSETQPNKTDKSFWRIKRFLQYRFNITVVFLLYLTCLNAPVIYNTIHLEIN